MTDKEIKNLCMWIPLSSRRKEARNFLRELVSTQENMQQKIASYEMMLQNQQTEILSFKKDFDKLEKGFADLKNIPPLREKPAKQIKTLKINNFTELLKLYSENGIIVNDCIDGGAGFGGTAKQMLECISENSTVYAFEPFEGNHRFFENLPPQIKLYKSALYNENTKKKFFVSATITSDSDWGKNGKEGYSSLGYLTDDTSRNPNNYYEVDCVVADSIVENPQKVSFVKLDLQGGELDALKGMQEITKYADIMWIEYTGQKGLLDYLFNKDFEVFDTEYFFMQHPSKVKDLPFQFTKETKLSTGATAYYAQRVADFEGSFEDIINLFKKDKLVQTDLVCVRKKHLDLLEKCILKHSHTYVETKKDFDKLEKGFAELKKNKPATPATPPPASTVPTEVPVFMPHSLYLDDECKYLAPYFNKVSDYNEFTYLHYKHTAALMQTYMRYKGGRIDEDKVQPKAWQDAISTAFIDQKITAGAKILEIGGGNSRVLEIFKNKHECWNLDKLEGLGAGPIGNLERDYKIVRDYIGSFSEELPDSYFDLLFSISVLEHVPKDEATLKNILDDMNRVLKPGGYAFHCIDIRLASETRNEHLFHPIIHYLFNNVETINKFTTVEQASEEYGKIRTTSKAVYDVTWLKTNNWPYEVSGPPTSIQIFWQKPL